MHLVDAEVLVNEFAQCDGHMPALVFGLLQLYLRDGPVPYDAGALAYRLKETPIGVRINPQELSAMEEDLHRFFDFGPQGLEPKAGVLRVDARA